MGISMKTHDAQFDTDIIRHRDEFSHSWRRIWPSGQRPASALDPIPRNRIRQRVSISSFIYCTRIGIQMSGHVPQRHASQISAMHVKCFQLLMCRGLSEDVLIQTDVNGTGRLPLSYAAAPGCN